MPSIVEQLCRLPIDYHEKNLSPLALVELSGLINASDALNKQAVLEILRRDPALIDQWQGWSWDKRCDGWVFAGDEDPCRVYRFSVVGAVPDDEIPYVIQGGRFVVHESLEFRDRAEACAEFIVREIQSIASLSKKPN